MTTIDLLKAHSSVRDFKDVPLSNKTKAQLISAAQMASTWQLIQATSIIDISDQKLREKVANVSPSKGFVIRTGAYFIFVADLNRQAVILKSHHHSLAGISSMDSLMAAMIDTMIAAQNMVVAAESLGLGICYIGGIRNDLPLLTKLLNLPKYTVPLVGLTIGVPRRRAKIKKPRLPQRNMAFVNQYDQAAANDLNDYDHTMAEYYQKRHSSTSDWSTKMLKVFSSVRRPEMEDYLRSQGFNI